MCPCHLFNFPPLTDSNYLNLHLSTSMNLSTEASSDPHYLSKSEFSVNCSYSIVIVLEVATPSTRSRRCHAGCKS